MAAKKVPSQKSKIEEKQKCKIEEEKKKAGIVKLPKPILANQLPFQIPVPPEKVPEAVEEESEILKLRHEMKKLKDELMEVKKAPPSDTDTVAINKRKLSGLLEGKPIKDVGGVENAIASLVFKKQELEDQLAVLKDELEKKTVVGKKQEKIDEITRFLERIEKKMVPNNHSRADNNIYHLSQRIAAIENEYQEMTRYHMPPMTMRPVYYQTPMQQPVYMHKPTGYMSLGQYRSRRDLYSRKPHLASSLSDPETPDFPHHRSGERSYVDGGDIAELCSALAATVDLVKKVIHMES